MRCFAIVAVALLGSLAAGATPKKGAPLPALALGDEATIIAVGDETNLIPMLGKAKVVTADSLVLLRAIDEFFIASIAAEQDLAFGKAIRASDPDGIEEIIRNGGALRVPLGTRVRVVEVELVGNTSLIVNDRLPIDPRGNRVVRITEGSMKGRAVEIPARNLRPIGESPKEEQPKAKSTDPAKRAATLLAAGKNLEKLKKVPAALDTYRRVVKEFAGTTQAAEAEARIKALGGRGPSGR